MSSGKAQGKPSGPGSGEAEVPAEPDSGGY